VWLEEEEEEILFWKVVHILHKKPNVRFPAFRNATYLSLSAATSLTATFRAAPQRLGFGFSGLSRRRDGSHHE